MTDKNILLDPDTVKNIILPQLNAALHKVAEPILEKAMKDIEAEMKKKLGSFVIGFLEHSFSVESFRDELRIVVYHKQKP